MSRHIFPKKNERPIRRILPRSAANVSIMQLYKPASNHDVPACGANVSRRGFATPTRKVPKHGLLGCHAYGGTGSQAPSFGNKKIEET